MNRERIGRRMLGLAGALGLVFLLTACELFNQLPVARIVADPLTGESPLIVQFDATGSTDADGKVVSYAWDFGDGGSSTDATPHHTYVVTDEATTFTVTLTVRDDGGGRDDAVQSVEVLPSGSGSGGTGAPVARFTVNRVVGSGSLTVTLDASASEAGAGSILEYDWNFGDGAKGVGMVVSHTYTPDETTEYVASLIVWNTEGTYDTEQRTLIVVVPADAADGDAPTADFDATDPLVVYRSENPTATPSLIEVSFDPRGSYADAGHAIDYYVWDFGDGENWTIMTSDLQVTHVYRLSSPIHTYVVRLFVYDDQGLEDSALLNLTLSQPAAEE